MSADAMSGRLSARMTSHPAKSLLTVPGPTGTRNDSEDYSSSPLRIRPAQAEAVIANLSGRDQALVTDVGRLRLMTGGQLARLYFQTTISGKRHARRVLEGLVRRRVLARLGRCVGGAQAGSTGFVYCLDVIGQRLLDPLGPVRRPWLPSAGFINHAAMVSECYVQLRERERTEGLELLDFQGEPACWRTFLKRGGGSQTLKPDAFVQVGLGDYEDRWFLECDRSTEELPRVQRKNGVYIQYWQTGKEDVFPRVLWVANRAGRAAALVRSLEELPEQHQQLFAVCGLSDFISTIASGAGTDDLTTTTRGGET
jgi:hypothetical protein